MDFDEMLDILDEEIKAWYECSEGEKPYAGYFNYSWTDLGNGDIKVHPSTYGGFMDSVKTSLEDFIIHVR